VSDLSTGSFKFYYGSCVNKTRRDGNVMNGESGFNNDEFLKIIVLNELRGYLLDMDDQPGRAFVDAKTLGEVLADEHDVASSEITEILEIMSSERLVERKKVKAWGTYEYQYKISGSGLRFLKKYKTFPLDESVSNVMNASSIDSVLRAWRKALIRRHTDPEGAITSARTLLEDVCKSLLKDLGIKYKDSMDLTSLYRLLTGNLDFCEDKRLDQPLKQLFGGCQNVVKSISTLRNKLGDAHGGKETCGLDLDVLSTLAVNLAGSISAFIIEAEKLNRDKTK